MKLNDIEEDLKPLLGRKLEKIIHDEHGFVLEFSGGRTFTGHLRLLQSDAEIAADMKVYCGYHGKIPKDKRIVRPLSCME